MNFVNKRFSIDKPRRFFITIHKYIFDQHQSSVVNVERPNALLYLQDLNIIKAIETNKLYNIVILLISKYVQSLVWGAVKIILFKIAIDIEFIHFFLKNFFFQFGGAQSFPQR